MIWKRRSKLVWLQVKYRVGLGCGPRKTSNSIFWEELGKQTASKEPFHPGREAQG